MTGEMCPSGMGTCRKCREGERGKPERGGDGDGDGCSRAELRLDEIGRCDSSVDARSPDGQAAKPSGRETARPPSYAKAGQGTCPLPVQHHVRQARPMSQRRHRNGGAGMAGPEPSRAEPSRADPPRPNPTQPNPTQPVKCKTGGSAKARIRSPSAFRQEDRSGCRDCGPGARRELWGPGSGGGVDLSSPWRGLNCQLRADGQCAGASV